MLELHDLSKSFEGQAALKDVSFTVAEGEVVAILGPSGSGKSTLLSIVAGLEAPDSGSVSWDGRDLAGVPAHRRGFGLMFQDFALFPHRDVFGNVAFGLQMAGQPPEAIKARVASVLQLVGLAGFDHRQVSNLSGGEQQRVALARALAPQPKLLMLDEPFGSLDRALRTRLLADLAHILRQAGQTSLYVTHDQEEAYAIADRIVLFDQGRVAQIAGPQELYRHPASAFVARFLGLHNLMPGRVDKVGGKLVVETPLGKFPAPKGAATGEVQVLFRPDAFDLGGRGKASLKGKVIDQQFQGRDVQLTLQVGEAQLLIDVPSTSQLPEKGKLLAVHFDPLHAIQVFPK